MNVVGTLILFAALTVSFIVIIYTIPKVNAWKYKKKINKIKEVIHCDFLIAYDNGMEYKRSASRKKKSESQVWDFSLLDVGIVGWGISGLNDLINSAELRKDGTMIFPNTAVYRIKTKEGEEFIWEKMYL